MKLIAISLDDATYNRLEQLALAKGMTISDYARTRLDIEDVRKATNDDFDKRVHDATIAKMRKDAEGERGKRYAYTVKVYRTVGKRIRIYWRTRPLTQYDALMQGRPDKAGMWEFVIQKETTQPAHQSYPSDHVEGDWYKEDEEHKYYYKRRGLHKAINTILRKYGQSEMYSEGPQQAAEPPGAEPVDDTDTADE